jgi:predicted Fe-Mo cluster-binding NifX family protein
MKVCFPAKTLEGMKSLVYEHFGSAPGFVIIDTESMNLEEIQNGDMHHDDGMCQPLKALGGRQVDALMKLQAQGIKVFHAADGTVLQNLDLIKNGNLPQFEAQHTCGGHEGGCAHH